MSTLTRDGDWTGFDGGATVKDIPAQGRRPRSGRQRHDDHRARLRPGDGARHQAAIAHASTIEIANGTTTLDRLALDLGGGTATVSGNGGLGAQPQRHAVGGAGLARQQFRARPRRRRLHLGHGQGHRRAPPIRRSATRSTGAGRADGADPRRRLRRHAASPRPATSPAASSTFDANAGDGAGLGLKGGGTVDIAGAQALSLDFSGEVPFSFLPPDGSPRRACR